MLGNQIPKPPGMSVFEWRETRLKRRDEWGLWPARARVLAEGQPTLITDLQKFRNNVARSFNFF